MNKEDYLAHWGIKGMKWGVRRYQNPDGSLTAAGRKRYSATSSDSNVTKRVKKDLSNLSGEEFRKKYSVSKSRYMKRVDKYGDPYMNAPLAKIGKFLEKEAKSNSERIMKKAIKTEEKKLSRSEKKIAAIQKDIDNLKSNKKEMLALKSKSGKPLFVEKDIDEMISGLEANKLKETRKASKKEEKKGTKIIDLDGDKWKVREDFEIPKKPKRDAFAETDKKVETLSPKDKETWNRYVTAMLGSRDKVDDGDLYERVFSEFKELRQDFSSKEIEELLDDLEHSDKTEDFLAHYGILGMKWGVRRFQNVDGTRTQAGNARRKNRTYSSDYEKSKSLRKKKSSELSNEELKQLNDRMRLEMQYKDLNKSTISKGSKQVGKILQNSGNTIALAYATAYGFKIAKKILGKIPS